MTQRNMPALIAQAREVTHDTHAVNYIDGTYIVPNNLRWILYVNCATEQE